jgi:CRP-like cAMP-binding protein
MDQKRPKPDGSLVALSQQAVRACDRFEEELKAGNQPGVEACLQEVDAAERPRVRAQLLSLLEAYGSPEAGDTTVARLTEPGIRLSNPGDRADRSTSIPAAAHVTQRREGPPDRETADSPASRVSLLGTIWPFSELPRSILRELLAEMSVKHFDPGDRLLIQGESCPHLLVLIEGDTEIRLAHGDGAEEVGGTRGAAIVGEMSLLSGEPCSATVVATRPVVALALAADRLRRLAARHHSLWMAFGMLTAERLGRQAIDILSGKVLGGYRIRRCIGRGGMAMVYEAERLESGERVALKMLSHRFCQNLEAQQRFEREVEICRALHHPHIAPVYDSFTAFATNFMVVGYCEGETLTDLIRREGSLEESRARDLLGQLASALAYAHAQGICHRDVKPSNIMVDPGGKLMLMDFGLAKSIATPDMTTVGQIMGTPRYMPPEQLAGQAVDQRADVYAVGCIVYEMLTGRALFPQPTYLEILQALMKFKLPAADEIRPGLSRDLYEVLQQSLAAEPADRVLDLERIARA